MNHAPAHVLRDGDLAARIRSRLEDEMVAARDVEFAQSLLAGFARYGSFSDRQRPYAERLALAAGTRAAPAAAPVAAGPTLTALAALFGPGRLARLTIGRISLHRRRDPADVVFVKLDGIIVAVIEIATGALRSTRGMRGDAMRAEVLALLQTIEADPVAAARNDSLRAGSCACCGRALVADESLVDRGGIGPICWERLTAV
jgi:hypothetical protein